VSRLALILTENRFTEEPSVTNVKDILTNSGFRVESNVLGNYAQDIISFVPDEICRSTVQQLIIIVIANAQYPKCMDDFLKLMTDGGFFDLQKRFLLFCRVSNGNENTSDLQLQKKFSSNSFKYKSAIVGYKFDAEEKIRNFINWLAQEMNTCWNNSCLSAMLSRWLPAHDEEDLYMYPTGKCKRPFLRDILFHLDNREQQEGNGPMAAGAEGPMAAAAESPMNATVDNDQIASLIYPNKRTPTKPQALIILYFNKSAAPCESLQADCLRLMKLFKFRLGYLVTDIQVDSESQNDLEDRVKSFANQQDHGRTGVALIFTEYLFDAVRNYQTFLEYASFKVHVDRTRGDVESLRKAFDCEKDHFQKDLVVIVVVRQRHSDGDLWRIIRDIGIARSTEARHSILLIYCEVYDTEESSQRELQVARQVENLPDKFSMACFFGNEEEVKEFLDSLLQDARILGYKVSIRSNLNGAEIKHEVKKFSEESDDGRSSVVAFMSHGRLGEVFGSDEEPCCRVPGQLPDEVSCLAFYPDHRRLLLVFADEHKDMLINYTEFMESKCGFFRKTFPLANISDGFAELDSGPVIQVVCAVVCSETSACNMEDFLKPLIARFGKDVDQLLLYCRVCDGNPNEKDEELKSKFNASGFEYKNSTISYIADSSDNIRKFLSDSLIKQKTKQWNAETCAADVLYNIEGFEKLCVQKTKNFLRHISEPHTSGQSGAISFAEPFTNHINTQITDNSLIYPNSRETFPKALIILNIYPENNISKAMLTDWKRLLWLFDKLQFKVTDVQTDASTENAAETTGEQLQDKPRLIILQHWETETAKCRWRARWTFPTPTLMTAAHLVWAICDTFIKYSATEDVVSMISLINEKLKASPPLWCVQTTKYFFITDTSRPLNNSLEPPSTKESAKAGLALIINNTFKNDSKFVREGSDIDREKLKSTFKKFGYDTKIAEDLSAEKVRSEVKQFADDSRHGDTCIVVIMSHGKLGKIIGLCRDHPDGSPSSNSDHPTRLVYPDMIVAHSTSIGEKSFRRTDQGSRFVNSLCDALDKFGKGSDIVSLISAINYIMMRSFYDKTSTIKDDTQLPFWLVQTTGPFVLANLTDG
uniref:CASPASE_P20 domain-containing protein n=1 Tax=Macrostomum lignano TaxID=282301 RepID=A0A1I8JCT2_9PLAT